MGEKYRNPELHATPALAPLMVGALDTSTVTTRRRKFAKIGQFRLTSFDRRWETHPRYNLAFHLEGTPRVSNETEDT